MEKFEDLLGGPIAEDEERKKKLEADFGSQHDRSPLIQMTVGKEDWIKGSTESQIKKEKRSPLARRAHERRMTEFDKHRSGKPAIEDVRPPSE